MFLMRLPYQAFSLEPLFGLILAAPKLPKPFILAEVPKPPYLTILSSGS